jgi:surface antigen
MSYIHSRMKVRSKRLLSLLLGFGLAAAMVVVTQFTASVPAFASTDTYPTQWAGVPMDTVFDTWGEYNRECTSYVAWMLSSVNGYTMPFHADASDWVTDAGKIPGVVINTTPAVGAVAWKSSGHVAWVEAVNSNGTVNTEDYNYSYNGTYAEHLGQAANYYQEYIHFDDIGTLPPVHSQPVSVVSGSNVDVFARGQDGDFYEDTYNGSSWGGFYSIAPGNVFANNPVAVATSSGVDVFALGQDGHMYEDTYNGSSWGGFYSIAPGNAFGNNPVAVSSGSNVDVFAIGEDGDFYEDTYNGSSWGGFYSIAPGNVFTSNPSAVSVVANNNGVDVFALGNDGHFYEDTYNGSSWGGFYSIAPGNVFP